MNNIPEEMITISREEYEKLIKLETKNTELETKANELETKANELETKANELETKANELEQTVIWLKEQLQILNAKRYVAATENISEGALEQLSLFANEAEWYQDYKPLKEEIKVAEHIRKRRNGSVKEILPENIETEVIEHRIEDPVCSECGSIMEVIGKEVKETLKLIPAKAILKQDVYYTYACRNCEKNNISVPIVKTPRDNPVIKGSYASAEAIAHIITQKFVMGSPLYRQEYELKRQGIELSRQTMSNWILTAADLWLRPLYDKLHKELVGREVLHADETTLRVLKETDKGSQSKCYMWLFRTSGDTYKSIVLYQYSKSRKGDIAEEYLKGFKGYLHTDGYQAYHNLKDITVVGCLAHVRRKFHEACEGGNKDPDYQSHAAKGEAFCTAICNAEKELKNLKAEERYTARLEKVKPIFEALLSWAKTIKAAPKSKLGKALTYLGNQRVYLENFYKDGRLEITNNRAERSIKPFVIDRKNFLFANTPSGAQGTAIMMSMVETAKENNLDPYRYLTWLFSKMPNTDLTVENSMDQFFPWNAPNECKAKA